VSVVIPVRDEEVNLDRVIRSLAGQQRVREILVVDDGSTDGTAAILGSLERAVPLLRAIRVDGLPAGWTGKAHAAALGAKEAQGEWFLFTDADTEHLPGSVAALVDLAEREDAALLSVSPGQVTPTWWEKAAIPRIFTELAQLYRFEEVSDPASPAAAANGQYMLIRRDAYERAGGWEAVRDELLEDVELARRIKAGGGKLLFLPGANWVRTRMYRTFSAMWKGWTKNLYLIYARNLRSMAASLAKAWVLDLLLPTAYVAACAGLLVAPGRSWLWLSVVGAWALLMARLQAYRGSLRKLGFDPALANYLVPGAALFGLLLLSSAYAHCWSGKVEWKGRVYQTRSPKQAA
jgi:glycosyltransferase involved in cell wall biosynthesis